MTEDNDLLSRKIAKIGDQLHNLKYKYQDNKELSNELLSAAYSLWSLSRWTALNTTYSVPERLVGPSDRVEFNDGWNACRAAILAGFSKKNNE